MGAFCNTLKKKVLTFIKLPFSIKTFVLYIFEWPLKTGFTVVTNVGLRVFRVLREGQKWNMLVFIR